MRYGVFNRRVKCVICEQHLDTESPYVNHARNPETFRVAWMHYFCFEHTYQELKNQPASKPIYTDRQDEFDTRFGG